jgi:hypothetical protein
MTKKTLLLLALIPSLASPLLGGPHNAYSTYGTSDYLEQQRQIEAAQARDRALDHAWDTKKDEDAELREWEKHMITPRLYSHPAENGGFTLFGIHF